MAYSATELAQQELIWRAIQQPNWKGLRTFLGYVYIWLKEGGDPLKLEAWDCQLDALEQFTLGRLIILLKTRQLGMSWMCVIYSLWKILTNKNFHVYFYSIGRDEVNEQVERFKFVYENLPDWMQERVQMGGRGRKENDSLVQFSNGSALHAKGTTKRAGHGAAPGLIFLDEFARNELDVYTYRAIKPALGTKCQVIVNSTSNGFGNLYEKLWHDAESGSNNFHPLFYPASSHPDYTPEFLAREKDDYAGDLVGYYEAYPESSEQAFMTSTRCPFDSERIGDALRHISSNGIKATIGRFDIVPDPEKKNRTMNRFVIDDAGNFHIFEPPIKGHRYTMGADVAEGLTTGDFSAAVVLDADTNHVVAMYRAKIKPDYYAKPLRDLATFYNNAFLAVEVNKGSELVMDDLKESYHWLYMRERKNRPWDVPTLEPGFYTSSTSKPRIIAEMRRQFASTERPLFIPSRIILTEMSTFIEDDKLGLGASKGNFDDTVMALAIAIEATNSMPRAKAKKFRSPHRAYGSRSL